MKKTIAWVILTVFIVGVLGVFSLKFGFLPVMLFAAAIATLATLLTWAMVTVID